MWCTGSASQPIAHCAVCMLEHTIEIHVDFRYNLLCLLLGSVRWGSQSRAKQGNI